MSPSGVQAVAQAARQCGAMDNKRTSCMILKIGLLQY